MRLHLFALLIFAILFTAGCTQKSKDAELLQGNWRLYTNVPSSDNSYVPLSTSRQLEMSAFGTWKYGDSSGTWEVSPITEEDWKSWFTEKYGPTRKITLHNWAGETVTGPMEESDGRVDFFWLIYYVQADGGIRQVQLKFGHGYGS